MDTSSKINILIVDDDAEARFWNQKEIFFLFGFENQAYFEISQAGTVDEMMELVDEKPFHLVLLDYDLGEDKNGEKVFGTNYIEEIKNKQPGTKVIVLTSHVETELIVKSINLGALDFLSKGESPEEIARRQSRIRQAIQDSRREMELMRSVYYTDNGEAPSKRYRSPAMKSLYTMLEQLSEFKSTVLLLGDPGLGKTHAAEQLHQMTKKRLAQRNRVFINVNMLAIPENLVESSLFGSEKGSFTGATTRQGYFEIAGDGDIFLDEIGDISLSVQGKLLKVLEERKFMRVGGTREIKTNARIILATNKDLKKMVELGTFRKDLYDRISKFPIQMPTLKDRSHDLPIIIQDICRKLSKETGVVIDYRMFPEELKEFFGSGQVESIREIHNSIERLIVMCKIPNEPKVDLRSWKKCIVHKPVKSSKQKTQFEGSFDELITRLSQTIIEERDITMTWAKKCLEARSILNALKYNEKPSEVGRLLGMSPSNAWNKIEKLEKGELEKYL